MASDKPPSAGKGPSQNKKNVGSENLPAVAEETPSRNKKKMGSENLPAVAEKTPSQKKKKMASENYRLFISLNNIDKPVITRTLSVPKTMTFHKLHQALQIAFSWDSSHLYKFEVVEPPPPKRRRRSNMTTLMQLEEHPDPTILSFIEYPLEKSTELTLQQVLDDPQYAGARIDYTYDFGDCWEHTVQKIGTEEGDGVIRCVAGEGRGVQEDCGGVEGWHKLKSIYKKISQADDREEAISNLSEEDQDWFGDDESTRALDPHEWSIDDVNHRLAKL